MKIAFASLALSLAFVSTAPGQTLTAPFAGSYSLLDLNSPSGVPTGLGGFAFSPAAPNTLYMVGDWDGGSAAVYSIGVTRGASGHITGFSGSASFFASAPGADGGLAFAPNGTLLYDTYPADSIGQIKPGSTSPDRIVTFSVGGGGTLGFVPAGLPGAGQFKSMNYSSGQTFNGTLTPDGSGTYGITESLAAATNTGSPAGFGYVNPGSPVFSGPSLLVTNYKNGPGISAYSVDSQGNPTGAGTAFITGLNLPRGGAVDPLTGDFIFGSFNSAVNHVYVVSGFAAPSVPEPSSLVLTALGLTGLVVGTRFRRKMSSRFG
jgi:hypothetical protein